jgi:hypothetical protein
MNRIDEAAEPLVEPMAFGSPVRLRDLHDILSVATWLTQIAILTDSIDPKVLSPEQRRWFFEHRRPFPGSGTHSPERLVQGWK